MDQDARITALEHLVATLIKGVDLSSGVSKSSIFSATQASILDSSGPGGPKEKTAALEYLEQIKSIAGTLR